MMLAFLTNKVPFFSYISNILLFFTQIKKKYAIFVITTKNEIICNAESINMWI